MSDLKASICSVEQLSVILCISFAVTGSIGCGEIVSNNNKQRTDDKTGLKVL
jgi:uncharacterized membrane protein